MPYKNLINHLGRECVSAPLCNSIITFRQILHQMPFEVYVHLQESNVQTTGSVHLCKNKNKREEKH